MTQCANFNTVKAGGPFIGSDAVRRGILTKRQLYSTRFRRLFHNVHISADVPITHELRCRAVAPTIPGDSVITGASAAAIYGVELGKADDPVEVVVPETAKFIRQHGLDVRRTSFLQGDYRPWRHIHLATPYRLAMDLLTNTRLRPSLPQAIGLLDVLLRARLVERDALAAFLGSRRVHGIIRARRATELSDSRAASVEESEIRVWLELAGLSPTVHMPIYRGESGERRYLGQPPLAFPRHKIAVYCEDDDDRNQKQEHIALRKCGWKIVNVPHDWLMHDPQRIVSAVRDA